MPKLQKSLSLTTKHYNYVLIKFYMKKPKSLKIEIVII